MPGFVNDAQVQDALADALHLPGAASLPAFHADNAVRANRQAYRELVDALAARGYSRLQVDAWPAGADWQEPLALLWALELGGGLEEVDRELLQFLKDKRAQLQAVLIYDADGKPVTPAFGGRVGSGEISSPTVTHDPHAVPEPPQSLSWPEWRRRYVRW